jgi:exodeoxyribonuclease V alpha subunit
VGDESFDGLCSGSYAFGEGGFSPDAAARLDRLFAHYGRSRVLSLTRVHAAGSEKLNAAFHRRLSRRLGSSDESWDFVAGEPVMMLRNDYERGLFNGDQGVVVWVRRSGQGRAELMAVFPGREGYRPFFLGALRHRLEHAFAMTVHKSQGSEFEHVALVLPAEDMPLLTREVVYTGLTRASESVLVVGSLGLFEAAASRGLKRYSGVAEKLVERLGPAKGKSAVDDKKAASMQLQLF